MIVYPLTNQETRTVRLASALLTLIGIAAIVLLSGMTLAAATS